MSKYDDIIELPHFHDPERPLMPLHSRAAQFAAYKALGEDFVMNDTAGEESLTSEIVNGEGWVDEFLDQDYGDQEYDDPEYWSQEVPD